MAITSMATRYRFFNETIGDADGSNIR